MCTLSMYIWMYVRTHIYLYENRETIVTHRSLSGKIYLYENRETIVTHRSLSGNPTEKGFAVGIQGKSRDPEWLYWLKIHRFRLITLDPQFFLERSILIVDNGKEAQRAKGGCVRCGTSDWRSLLFATAGTLQPQALPRQQASIPARNWFRRQVNKRNGGEIDAERRMATACHCLLSCAVVATACSHTCTSLPPCTHLCVPAIYEQADVI